MYEEEKPGNVTRTIDVFSASAVQYGCTARTISRTTRRTRNNVPVDVARDERHKVPVYQVRGGVVGDMVFAWGDWRSLMTDR